MLRQTLNARRLIGTVHRLSFAPQTRFTSQIVVQGNTDKAF
jgi:hypothetical protein